MKKTPHKLSSQIVGNVGLYYACYKLSLLGWNVMPTARNAKGIDIVAYNQTGKRMLGIQVKTLSGKNAVSIGTSLEKVMGDFWVVLTNAVAEDEPSAFVMTAKEVEDNAVRDKGGQRAYWLEAQRRRNPKRPDTYEKDEFKEAWNKIGRGDGD